MNLFIGLLNMAIDNYNKDEEFLLLRAQVFYFKYFDLLELFYLNSNYIFIITLRLLWKLNYFI